jgi:hypothetical protein
LTPTLKATNTIVATVTKIKTTVTRIITKASRQNNLITFSDTPAGYGSSTHRENQLASN